MDQTRSGFAGRPGFPDHRKPPFPPSSTNNMHKGRTSHACNRCRMMRTKCSGENPCSKCTKDAAVCLYGDRKREKNKKDLVESVERVRYLEDINASLTTTLRKVVSSPGLPTERHAEITELLSMIAENEAADTSQESSAPSYQDLRSNSDRSSRQTGTSVRGAEERAPSKIGSPGTQGELSKIVDLGRGTGAAGYLGKMSDISWTQRAREYLAEPHRGWPNESQQSHVDTHSLAANDFSYFMDDEDLLAVDEDHINARLWPPIEIATVLSEAFFHSVQGAFYFLRREQFLRQLVSFSYEKEMLSWSERRWLALANLIWAIGAKWLSLCQLDQGGFWENHLFYYARARALGLDHRVSFDHPDVDRVQGIGLIAFFLLVNGSISRSYTTLGHAIRHATALGLHLKVTDPTIDLAEQVRRAQTWYSLYCLEILLAEITGRPKSISMEDVTVEISILDFAQQQELDSSDSSSQSRKVWLDFLRIDRSLPQGMRGGTVPWGNFVAIGRDISPAHFPQRVRLCRISDKVGSILYRNTASQTWLDTQNHIEELQGEIAQWLEDLPEELNIDSQMPAETDPRAKIELSMYFHSVQMMLHRPCLCKIDLPDQSARSEEFNYSCARACVHAAMSMLAIIPDNPSAHEVYQLLPWWTLLHYLSQAASVLILEFCLDLHHFEGDPGELTPFLKKAMSYLFCIAQGSLSAYKSWRILRHLVSGIAEKYPQLDLAEVAMEAQYPPGWTDQDDFALQKILL